MMIRHLKTNKGNESKNQIAVTQNNTTSFYSYGTLIAVLDNNAKLIKVTSDYDYSRTTKSYFYKFLDTFSIHVIEHTEKELQKLFKRLDITIK